MDTLKPLFALTFLIVSVAAHASSCQPVIDDAGQTVVLAKPATRIISLAPDLTETLYAIGAGKQLIATVTSSDYPLEAKKLKHVGSYSGIDVEAIMALKPDLIVTWGGYFSNQLKKLAVPIYVAEPKKWNDVASTMQRLGCLTGRQQAADQAAKQFLAEMLQLKRQYQASNRKTVFFQIGDYALITINKESWINQVIALCGGENIFQTLEIRTPNVSLESVLRANPAVILSDTTNPDWQLRWRQYPQITAVQHNRLISIQPDLIDRAGPRLIQGARQVCRAIQSGQTDKIALNLGAIKKCTIGNTE